MRIKNVPRLLVLAGLLASACSVPRIMVLHDPLTAADHERLGLIYEAKGKTDLAIDQYQQAAEKDRKQVSPLLRLGDLSYRRADYLRAESAYTRALELNPQNAAVRNNLAWVYIRTGRKLERAQELVTEALKVNPDRRAFYLDTLGVILLKQGNAPDAVTALRESVASLPEEDRDLLVQAWGHLADACSSSGDDACYEEAVRRQKSAGKKPVLQEASRPIGRPGALSDNTNRKGGEPE